MPSTWFKSIFGVKVSEPCQMTSWKLHFFRKVQYKLAIFRPGPHFEILKIWIFEVYFVVNKMAEKKFDEKNLNGLILTLENRWKPIFWHIWDHLVGHAHISKFSFFQKCEMFLCIFKIHIVMRSEIVFLRRYRPTYSDFSSFLQNFKISASDLYASKTGMIFFHLSLLFSVLVRC